MELLAPAGNFATAIAAFEAGAEAVYLGLKQFSARKRADNFSWDELRRLKQYAVTHQKKIYVTLNTLVQNSELEELFHVLRELVSVQIDAVIIQDLGLLSLIKDHFPSLPVHASTQMAIHSIEGAKQAEKNGFERIVLSRECTFRDIEKIRQACPSLQLEVFIHGALCYSFSGLCLASGLLLGRSGNRGECAQICRTFFQFEDKSQSYPFSCNDLGIQGEIEKLIALGVHSFKIEGRMKSVEYVSSTVGHYHGLISKDDSSKIFTLLENSRLAFSRQLISGYFHAPQGEKLINPDYPGHQGIEVGEMVKEGNQLLLSANYPLRVFDTLAFFRQGKLVTRGQFKQITFRGKRVDKVSPRQKVSFLIPPEVNGGDSVFLVGRSEAKTAGIDYKQFPAYKIAFKLQVELGTTQIYFKLNSLFSWNKEVKWLPRQGTKGLKEALSEQFSKSAEYPFLLSLSFEASPLLDSSFLPPSEMKEIKRQVYAAFEEFHRSSTQSERLSYPSNSETMGEGPISRASLFLADEMPFVQDELDLNEGTLPRWQNHFVLPLSPILFDEEKYFAAIKKFIDTHADESILLGLNNLAHLKLVDDLANNSRVSFFVDYGLYVANSFALSFLLHRVPRLLFAYSWCESSEKVPGTILMCDAKRLPLFLSRGCFLKNRGQSCATCQKQHREVLKNGDKRFIVAVKRCLTYLFFQ